MRLLNAICLLVIVSGLSWIGRAADETPASDSGAAAATADDTALQARENLLAIPPALHERRHWSVRLDMVMFTPLSDALPIVLDDPDNDGLAEGRLRMGDYNQDNEFRPALQYNCVDGNTLFEINYLRLQQINDLDFAPKAGAARYWTPLVSPNLGNDFALSADTRLKLTYIEFNLNLKHTIRREKSMAYFVDAGIRWIRIEQKFRGLFLNMNGGASTDDVTIHSLVNAGGFTLGGSMEYRLFDGFHFTGRFGAVLLQGSIAGSYNDVNSAGGLQGEAGRQQNGLVPGLEAAVMFNYNPDLELPYAGFVVFNAGYEMKNYFQVIDTTTFVDDVQDGTLLSRRTSFGISGYVFSVQFIWPVD